MWAMILWPRQHGWLARNAFSGDMVVPELTMVYGRYNELVDGVYCPTYNWGAPSCRIFDFPMKTSISIIHLHDFPMDFLTIFANSTSMARPQGFPRQLRCPAIFLTGTGRTIAPFGPSTLALCTNVGARCGKVGLHPNRTISNIKDT